MILLKSSFPLTKSAPLTAERAERRKIGFSCGSFDLLHPGHVQYLHLARQRCDRLLVAVNSDASCGGTRVHYGLLTPSANGCMAWPHWNRSTW